MEQQRIFTNVLAYEQAEELVAHLAKLHGEPAKEVAAMQQLLKSHTEATPTVAATIPLIAADAATLLLKTPEHDLDGVFNLLVTLTLTNCGDGSAAVLKTIVDTLVKTETSESQAFSVLKILVNAYNLLGATHPSRYDLLVAVFTIASRTNKIGLLLHQLPQIQRWIEQSLHPVDRCRSLLLFISDTLKSRYPEESHKFLLKYLATFDQANTLDLETSKNAAMRAVIDSLRIPNVIKMDDLVQLKAIKELKEAKMVELLNIFLNDGVREYLEFYNKNKDYIEQHGLSHEQNLKKIRLIALTALAAEHLLDKVPYKTIAQAIDVPVDEVESWIIDAIRIGVIEAKMDQLDSVMIVNRATNRKFEMAQWRQLQESLNSWKASVADVLQVVDNAKLVAQNAS